MTANKENTELHRRLEEAEETIRAIQDGAVDAFVVSESTRQRVYTLEAADRPYRLLIEEMQQGAATLHGDGTIIYCNRQLAKLLKISHQKLVGTSLRVFIADEDLSVYDKLLREGKERSGRGEAALRPRDGSRLPAYLTFNALPEECGAAIGVLVTDLTNQRHQEHLKLLVDELNHRVKNTLASVQSIAQQTLLRTGNSEEFAASFSGRIQALARVHTMLSQITWQGADLRTLIHHQLSLGPVDESRLKAWGPAVMLEPQFAVHLAMVIHELGTNSCKYGALSVPAGRITANWTVEAGQLLLSWKERGGPAVAAPARRGFGSVFIEQSVRGHRGEAQMFSEPEGVSWTITLPLVRSMAGSASSMPPVKMDGASIETVSSNERAAMIKGKRVLVVEDEPLVAMDLVEILKLASAEPAGPVGTAVGALQLIESEALDAALVDANLGGMPVDEIAHALVRRNVPFAFVTGYDRAGLPPHFQNIAMLSKPFSAASLLEIVNKILSQQSG